MIERCAMAVGSEECLLSAVDKLIDYSKQFLGARRNQGHL